jgi:hypothetical protein
MVQAAVSKPAMNQNHSNTTPKSNQKIQELRGQNRNWEHVTMCYVICKQTLFIAVLFC